MNHVFTLVCALFIQVCFAQKESWEIGTELVIGACAPITYKKLDDGYRTKGNEGVGYLSTGLLSRKFFKNHYGIEWGLQVSHLVVKRSKYEQITNTNGANEYVFFFHQQNYFLGEIPLRFIYKKAIKKFDLGAIVGFTPAIVISFLDIHRNNGSPLTTLPGSVSYDRRKTNQLNVFADLGFLFRVNVYKKLYFEAKPMVKISCLTLQQEEKTPFLGHVVASGSHLGLMWKL